MQSWPNLRYAYCSNICLEGLRETTEILSQDSRFLYRDLNPCPPEYNAGVLTIQPRRSAALKKLKHRRFLLNALSVSAVSNTAVLFQCYEEHQCPYRAKF
jgi:hypothetical protein